MEKKICIIAHDKMKPVLVSFLREHEDWLWNRRLIATGLTAEFIEHRSFKVPVDHVQSGREGGYRQLADQVENGEISMVLFFRDPEIVQDYASDVTHFVKTCIRQNVPFAFNPASAELLIIGMIRMDAVRKKS